MEPASPPDCRSRLHRRFEAAAPHDIWQTDAKGPFTVSIGRARVAAHVVTGASGTGKTSLLRHVATQLDRHRVQVLYIAQAG